MDDTGAKRPWSGCHRAEEETAFSIPAEADNLSMLDGEVMRLSPAPAGLFLACGLNVRGWPSNVLQCLFAQDIGIAFAGLCKIDDLPRDCLFDVIVRAGGWRRDAVKPVSFSPLRDADKKGGALTRLLVVATGEVLPPICGSRKDHGIEA